jgi:uncharacterized protein (TIGR03437 family)
MKPSDTQNTTGHPDASAQQRRLRRAAAAARVLLAAALALTAAGQSSAPFLVQSIPVGVKPAGIDFTFTGNLFTSDGTRTSPDLRVWAAVANSGDDSVSILVLTPDFTARVPYQNIAPFSVIRGVPSPYAVSSCGTAWTGKFLVTSPSDGSVSLLDAPSGSTVSTLKVGPQPYSATCGGTSVVSSCGTAWTGKFLVTSPSDGSVSLLDAPSGSTVSTLKVGPQPYSATCGGTSVVSNYGDSTLSLVQTTSTSLTLIKTIPNVPGSRGPHGLWYDGSRFWVAGTDANVVTVVDLNSPAVVTRIPVRGPTALRGISLSGMDGPDAVAIASSLDNNIVEIRLWDLQVARTLSNVPSPQDLVSCRLGDFASTGPGNSVAWLSDSKVTLIPGIPGAKGLACWSAQYSSPPSPPSLMLVTSPDSNSVAFIQQQPATPHDFPIANGASFATLATAAGSLASIFTSTGAKQNYSASAVPLPTSLGGVTLRLGGTLDLSTTAGWVYSPTGAVQAPLLFVGPNQINFQVPPGLAASAPLPVQLTRADGTTSLTTVSLAQASPGLFSLTMNGQGQGAVLNQDNTLNFGTNPARRGSVIQIFATGAGETTPALAAGEAAPASGNPLLLTKVQPTVTIGGKNAKVQFSGMAPGFVGLWQINAEVPADVTPGMALPLVITAAGVQSNTVTIAVQ